MVGGVTVTIEKYEVSIKVLGPVHIGEGTTLKKQDYIYDYHQSRVHFIDGPKLMKYLKNNGLLEKYHQFLRYPPSERQRESALKYFLENVGIKKSEWSQFTSFSVFVHQGKGNAKGGSKPLNDIQLMVRDGRNEVYVPGSSLKGLIKTALVALHDNDKLLYHKLRVSDSESINELNLAIYEKVDINKTDKPMPLYRECIDVGTNIQMQMSIEDNAFDIKEIEDAIQKFYSNYYDKWLSGFDYSMIGKQVLKDTAQQDKNIIYLGGGAGFVSKTLHYQKKSKRQAKSDIMDILEKKFYKTYGKMKSIPENVPIALKATYNQSQNKWLQQGMCQISFNKID